MLRERLLPTRAHSALKVFHDLLVSMSEMARSETVSIALGKILDQTGYLKDLREEHTEEAQSREENLMELVSAAREYEVRIEGSTLGGFVDQLSLLSDVDETEGSEKARVWLMTMHAAKGLEFPVVIIPGMEEGLFPHIAREAGRAGARGRAASLLRRHHARAAEAGADERVAAARVRRVSVDRAVTVPR